MDRNAPRTRRPLRAAWALGLLLVLGPALPAHSIRDPLENLTAPELLAQAESLPPAGLYLLASRLFAAGQRDDAARFLYVAQIRARYHLATTPGLPPSAEPALYAALQESVGRPINEWAFGDIPALAERMREALDWDAAHPNAMPAKSKDPAALDRIRTGLAQLRLHVLADQDGIRRQRRANGLVNR